MFFLYVPPSIKVESLWINWDECAEKAFLEVATEYEWSGYLTTLASITIEETSPMETRMQDDPLHMKVPLVSPFQQTSILQSRNRAESWLPLNELMEKIKE